MRRPLSGRSRVRDLYATPVGRDAVEERRLADPLLRVSAGEVHERKITQFQLFGPDFSYILHLFCGLIRDEYTKNCTFSGRVG